MFRMFILHTQLLFKKYILHSLVADREAITGKMNQFPFVK